MSIFHLVIFKSTLATIVCMVVTEPCNLNLMSVPLGKGKAGALVGFAAPAPASVFLAQHSLEGAIYILDWSDTMQCQISGARCGRWKLRRSRQSLGVYNLTHSIRFLLTPDELTYRFVNEC